MDLFFFFLCVLSVLGGSKKQLQRFFTIPVCFQRHFTGLCPSNKPSKITYPASCPKKEIEARICLNLFSYLFRASAKPAGLRLPY
ncbi:MAG TPA: hypothetical protein PKW33_09580 [Anaerolineaceae bacterium]|nr:hypothetical protein [Anaerolineaceae bacterium]HPN51827.1 hypothetical protein [Anaerolineaceae bacterium]